MTTLHDDRAIDGGEALPDRLERLLFAGRIAAGLKELPKNTCIAISIEGSWGVGKTSVLNLVEKAFADWPQDEQPIVVKFNPWLVGSVENLAQSFIVQVAAAVEIRDRAGEGVKAARQLLAYAKVFDVLRLIPGAEPMATLVKGVVVAVGGAAEKVSNLKALDLSQRRAAVIEGLSALNRRIVVFIDDLDRLPPKEVAEMIRLIKAVGDFPGIAYLVGFDAAYVEKALDRNGIPDSGSYLDKIIQIRLHVPEVDSERLGSLIDEEFESLPEAAMTALPETGARVQEIFFHGLRDLIETPRDIKRLFNRLYFVEPSCRGEVNLGDLLALEALALKAPRIYQHIRDDPEAYVGRPLYRTFVMDDPEKIVEGAEEARGKLIEELPQALRRPTLRLLHALFPLTGPHVSLGRNSRATALGLIEEPSRLAIALSVGLPFREASLSDAYALLARSDIRDSVLNDALARGRFHRLIGHLTKLSDEAPTDLPALATSLGRSLDTTQAREAEQIDFIGRPSVRIWHFLEEQLDRIEPASAYPVLLALAKNSDCISLATSALAELRSRLDQGQQKVWVSEDEWTELVRYWADNVKTWIAAGKLNELARGSAVLLYLREWAPADAKSVTEALLTSDQGVDQLMLSIEDSGNDSARGRFVQLGEKDLDHFGGIEHLRGVARRRLAEHSVQPRLKVIYKAILTGKRVYVADGRAAD